MPGGIKKIKKKQKSSRTDEVSKKALRLRKRVDDLDYGSVELTTILGFSHNMYLKLSRKFEVEEEYIEILNKKIMDFVQQEMIEGIDTNPSFDIKQTPLLEIFMHLRTSYENGTPSERAYLLGFFQGLLNRLMRKLGIEYQLPRP